MNAYIIQGIGFGIRLFLMAAYTGAISLIINIARNLILLKSNLYDILVHLWEGSTVFFTP